MEKDNQIKFLPVVILTRCKIPEYVKIPENAKCGQKAKDVKIAISCGMKSCKYFENVDKVLTLSNRFVSNISIRKFLDHVKCHLAKMLQKCQHLTEIQLLQIIHYEIEDSILWRNTILENGLDLKIPQVCEWNFQTGTECNYQFQNFQDFLAHYYSHCNQVTIY